MPQSPLRRMLPQFFLRFVVKSCMCTQVISFEPPHRQCWQPWTQSPCLRDVRTNLAHEDSIEQRHLRQIEQRGLSHDTHEISQVRSIGQPLGGGGIQLPCQPLLANAVAGHVTAV